MAEKHTRTVPVAGERIIISVLALLIALTAGIMTGCGSLDGDVATNQLPVVEYTNIPANNDTFSYAPVIHWKGRDPDGFVEEYMYADVIDSTALIDPRYYISFIPEDAWVKTQATSDTVYLLTETGRITEHVFYLKCIDDRQTESPVIYRTFYRSNRPPKVPEIKWFTDSDDAFGERITVTDTSYSLDVITESWPGIGFNWRSSDPDDRELYRIPLEFKYYLEKVPHDTVWEWVSQTWTTRQDITLAGLETGHYTLTVWARDDGYEVSERPASASFDVYKPTFEQPILLFNTTRENLNDPGRGNVLPGNQVGDLYKELSARYPTEYFHYTANDTILPFKAFLGRFKLVVWFSENKDRTAAPFEREMRDYVRAGGRLWVMGAFVRSWTSDMTIAMAESSFPGTPGAVSVPSTKAEFTGAISGVRGMPSLEIDTAKTGEIFRSYWRGPYKLYPCLPGVDVITTGSGAETVYTFSSYSDTASGDVIGEQAFVRVNVDTIYYPPTSVACLIEIERPRVLKVTRVENVTRGKLGQVQTLTNNVGRQTVVRVSYEFGEPWSVDDSIVVDYEFQPSSDFHRKPIAIRYEKVVEKPGGAFEVRYRVAVFTFPLYFLNNVALPDHEEGSVSEMYNAMLDWFFYPYAH